MTKRYRVLVVSIGCLLGGGLASAEAASADATFDCSSNTHHYSVAAGQTLAIDGSGASPTRDGDCTMSGTIPAGATVTLDAVGVTAASGSGNAGTLKLLDLNIGLKTGAGGTFTNSGTIVDQATGYRQQLYAGSFVNTGTIEDAGSGSNLVLDPGPGNAVGELVNKGTLRADAGASLQVNTPNTVTFAPGSTTAVAPTGTLQVSHTQLRVDGGTVTGQPTIFASGVTFGPSAAGTTGALRLTSNDSLAGTVPAGWTLSLDGAGVAAASGTTNAGTIAFTTDLNDGIATPAGGTFANTGTIVDQAAGHRQALYAGTFLNAGTIEDQGAGSNLVFDGEGGGATGLLENASGAALEADAGANFQVQTPVSLKLDGGSTVAVDPTGTLQVSHTGLDVAGGAVTGKLSGLADAVTFEDGAGSSTGTLEASSDGSLTGTIPAGWTVRQSAGALAAQPGAANAGTLVLVTGNPTLKSDGSFTNAGVLRTEVAGGTAFVTAAPLVNAGTLRLPAGDKLSVTGGLTLAPTSVLDLGIAGTAPSAFAAVQATGAVAVDGTLSLARDPAYAPGSGDAQQIITGGSIGGTFAQTLGGDGQVFSSVQFRPTSVTVVSGDPGVSTQPVQLIVAPALSGLKATGGKLSYTDSVAGLTTFTLKRKTTGKRKGKACVAATKRNRKAESCKRTVRAGSFTHQDAVGAVTVALPKKLKGRKLAKGSYVVTATTVLAGQKSKAVTVTVKLG